MLRDIGRSPRAGAETAGSTKTARRRPARTGSSQSGSNRPQFQRVHLKSPASQTAERCDERVSQHANPHHREAHHRPNDQGGPPRERRREPAGGARRVPTPAGDRQSACRTRRCAARAARNRVNAKPRPGIPKRAPRHRNRREPTALDRAAPPEKKQARQPRRNMVGPQLAASEIDDLDKPATDPFGMGECEVAWSLRRRQPDSRQPPEGVQREHDRPESSTPPGETTGAFFGSEAASIRGPTPDPPPAVAAAADLRRARRTEAAK